MVGYIGTKPVVSLLIEGDEETKRKADKSCRVGKAKRQDAASTGRLRPTVPP